jgi:hypothetical protein
MGRRRGSGAALAVSPGPRTQELTEVRWDVERQQRALARKLTGHYAYFGVTSNYASLGKLWHETKAI